VLSNFIDPTPPYDLSELPLPNLGASEDYFQYPPIWEGSGPRLA